MNNQKKIYIFFNLKWANILWTNTEKQKPMAIVDEHQSGNLRAKINRQMIVCIFIYSSAGARQCTGILP